MVTDGECCLAISFIFTENKCCDDFCKDKNCCCYNERLYPQLTRGRSIICCSLNCCPFTSGLGTVVSAFMSEEDCWTCVKTFMMGIVQVALTAFLIGWIMSILHGVRLYEKSHVASKV